VEKETAESFIRSRDSLVLTFGQQENESLALRASYPILHEQKQNRIDPQLMWMQFWLHTWETQNEDIDLKIDDFE
jgi:hypothetical protein